MSGVRNMPAGISSINRLRGAIVALPLRIRTAVAKDAVGFLNNELTGDFDAGRTVYGDPRPLAIGKKTVGQRLTLKKSGATRAELGFTAIGTIVRAVLGRKYQKFLVGKYKVLPASLPAKWREGLEKIVREYREDWEREALR